MRGGGLPWQILGICFCENRIFKWKPIVGISFFCTCHGGSQSGSSNLPLGKNSFRSPWELPASVPYQICRLRARQSPGVRLRHLEVQSLNLPSSSVSISDCGWQFSCLLANPSNLKFVFSSFFDKFRVKVLESSRIERWPLVLQPSRSGRPWGGLSWSCMTKGFFGFKKCRGENFLLGHAWFHSKQSMEMALKGRDKGHGDPLSLWTCVLILRQKPKMSRAPRCPVPRDLKTRDRPRLFPQAPSPWSHGSELVCVFGNLMIRVPGQKIHLATWQRKTLLCTFATFLERHKQRTAVVSVSRPCLGYCVDLDVRHGVCRAASQNAHRVIIPCARLSVQFF